MVLVCIIGDRRCNEVANKLEKLGFKLIKEYTTDKEADIDNCNCITNDMFNDYLRKGRILKARKKNSKYYGLPVLYGYSRYVTVTDEDGYTVYKERYGAQVVGIHLSEELDSVKDINSIVADILKKVRQ